jgi:LPXTG-motif cell wall-anchored protein
MKGERVMKRRKMILIYVLALAMIFSGISFNATSFAANPNQYSIKTTDSTGNNVNDNFYNTKQDVYVRIDGEPFEYYVFVVSPNGTMLGSGGPFDPEVVFNLYDATHFDDTDNPGGSYNVWVGLVQEFDHSKMKNDHFKVRGAEPEDPLGEIDITKVVVDHEDEVITGNNTEFEFRLYMWVDDDWEEVDDESPFNITGNDTVTIDGLPLGKYKVVEEDTPDGFELDSANDVEVTLDKNHLERKVEFTNKMDDDSPPPPPWEGTIRIQKLIREEPNESLAGFEFELWKDGVKVRGPESTDEYGKIDFTDLPAGEYEIRELESDFIADYLDDNPLEIGPEIENDNDDVWVVRVNNTRIEIDDIVVQKLVSNDDDLSGFVFRLYRIVDDEEEFVAERTTGVTGRVVFEDQPDGEYVLYEVPKNGYAMGIGAPGSDDGEEFFHSENMTYPIEVTNRKLPTPELGEIEVEKTVLNKGGNTFSSNTRFYFILQIFDDEWETIDSGSILGNGTLVFDDLEDGQYRVREVDIDSDFYLVGDNNIEVEIEDGSFEDVEFVNRQRPLPPDDDDDDDDDRPRPRPEPEDEDEDEDEPEQVLETTVVVEEPIPEAPPVVEVVEEVIPLATLPKTGASDATLFSGLGAAMLGLGLLIKKRR